jgi:3-isopropylmalate/(R)-2-methylmalate dehydratase small subunit
MQAFTQMTGIVAPLDRVNVDTDQIIPKQFLKTIKRTGLREGLFYDWRKQKDGSPDPAFFLNQRRYHDATILLTRDNFGCGSSREHAPWALLDQGFRCVIASSFADIFYNNCFQNGILPVVLRSDEVQSIMKDVLATEGYKLSVDLGLQTVTTPTALRSTRSERIVCIVAWTPSGSRCNTERRSPRMKPSGRRKHPGSFSISLPS